MHLETLQSILDAAIARHTDVELFLASERVQILPLSTKVLPTGELEIAASDGTHRNAPHAREGRSLPLPLPHTHTLVIVPASVQIARIRELPKP